MRKDFFTPERFGKILSPAQKVIIFGGLFSAILVFIYSFIFMTPFSDLYQIDGQFLFTRMINFGLTEEQYAGLEIGAFYFSPMTGEKIGMNLAYFTSFTRNEFQVFNHWLFAFGVAGLLVSLLPFVYFSQKRKIYYKTNLVVNSAVGGFNLYIGIHMAIQLVINQKLFWGKDLTLINAYETYLNDNSATKIVDKFTHAGSNGVFIFGYFICLAVIAFAALTILLTVAKYLYQRKQPKVDLSKVVIHE